MSAIDELFYNFPTINKPPFDSFLKWDEDKKLGCTVQFALAGMKREEIEVSIHSRNLRIKGNNFYSNYISPKFYNDFDWELAVTNKSDIDNCEISFIDGLLSIYIPFRQQPDVATKVLF